MTDRIFAMIGRFSVFCAVVIGGCVLASLAIAESERRDESEDDYDDYDYDDDDGGDQ